MYCEVLPPSCPPADASEHDLQTVFRRIDSSTATPQDFMSHAALGKKALHPVDPCKWASCSLFRSKTQVVNISARLPKPRSFANFVAELNIPAGSGKWMEGKRGHIDFWAYAAFNPLTAVSTTVSLEEI